MSMTETANVGLSEKLESIVKGFCSEFGFRGITLMEDRGRTTCDVSAIPCAIGYSMSSVTLQNGVLKSLDHYTHSER